MGAMEESVSKPRRGVPRSHRAWAMAAGLLATSCGGGDDPSPARGGDPGSPIVTSSNPRNCPGAEGVGDNYSVFAAPVTSGGLCGWNGARGACNIELAIDLCASLNVSCTDVRVQHGLYVLSRTLVLPAGMRIYGGCRSDDEADLPYRSVITSGDHSGAPAIRAKGLQKPTTFANFVVVSAGTTAEGTANVAMEVSDSPGLVMTHTTLVSGAGGPGANAANAGTADPGNDPACATQGGTPDASVWGEAATPGPGWRGGYGGNGSFGAGGAAGGLGGQQGGASIALLLGDASFGGMGAVGNRVLAGSGGAGGAGGPGLATNGAGSGGAGGNGGPSIGVASFGGVPAPPAGAYALPGSGGAGGARGSGGSIADCTAAPGSAGKDGPAAGFVDLSKPPS